MTPTNGNRPDDQRLRALENDNRGHLQLTKFNEIGKALASSLDLNEILNIVMEKISELLRPQNWSLLMVDEETQELRFELVVGDSADKIKKLKLKVGEGIAGWVAKERMPLLVPDVSKDPRFSSRADALSSFKTVSVICVPLVTRDRCLGVIELINKVEDHTFADEDLLVLTTLADYTAIAIENAIFFNKVQELTITDDLTKLYNSRFMHSRLEYEINRAKRFKNDLSMIFLDLDHFKDVNDTHGHLRGSKLLQEVAQIIVRLLRKVDMACRYGGDEFVLLMPNTPKRKAVIVAEKLRNRIIEASFLNNEGLDLRLSGSFGVASFPDDADNKDKLIQMADAAMYRVKNTTRDGVAEA